MRNRVEILKDGTWHTLRLKDNHAIKYNAVINRVGEVRNREISHSNTFSIPNTSDNRKALGLNVFNASDMARALNSKYEAKYYIGDKLVKEGFVVINNSETDIKINFLDGALGIVDTWKSTTFKELLQSEDINRPADYQTALDEMQAYNMATGSSPWTQLNNVGTRGHNLALFPNTLNQVGDKFQRNSNGQREDDVFLPSQSRPVFNSKAVFDLACESYGYTPIYDTSVDWTGLALRYFSGDKASDGKEPEDVLQTIVHPPVAESKAFMISVFFPYSGPGLFPRFYQLKYYLKYASPNATTGAFLNGANIVGDFPLNIYPAVETANPFVEMTRNDARIYDEVMVFQPDLSGGNVGKILFEFDANPADSPDVEHFVKYWGVWETTSASTDYVIQEIPHDDDVDDDVYQIDKTFLNTPPAEASAVFKGIIVILTKQIYQISYSLSSIENPILNIQVTETAIPQGEITFGDYNDYSVTINDLTHAAPDKSVKDVLSGLMHQAGILMNINANSKTIKFFGYGHYQTQKENGIYEDWSKYFRKYETIKRNTDYGKNYGRVNRIGLGKPFFGNTYDRPLTNHVEDSKYKSFSKDELKDYNDVTKVSSISNTNFPYFEYKVEGMSLVEHVGYISGMSQKTPFGVSQGTILNVGHMSNVNYLNLPYGVSEWYNLVDRALRVTGKFLLPVSVVRGLDISKPIYVSDLGGFYIIEEISEYVDSKTMVNVKLIKLIDNLRES